MNQKGQGIAAAAGALLVAALVIGLIVVLVGFRTVDQGETCVKVRFGEVVGVAPTGVSWANRLIVKYRCYPSRGIMYQTAANAQGDADFMDYHITANTDDGQKVEVTANVVFHVEPEQVEFVYSEVGQHVREVKTRVVANYTRSYVRNIVPSYEAIDLYTSGRVNFEAQVRDELRAQFAEYGVTLDEFSLRAITFDTDYAQVLEDKQVALERVNVREYEAQQAKFEADRAAELARGEADAAIERARGDAEAAVLSAKAEAEAIALRGKALEEYPEVLQLNFIKNLSTAQWLMLPSDGIQQFLPLDVLE